MGLFKGKSQTGRSGWDNNYNFGLRWLIEEYKKETMVSKVYGVILKHYKQYGFGPSVREIAAAVNVKSTSTVHYHLKTLETYKCIARSKNISRGIVPLVDTEAAV